MKRYLIVAHSEGDPRVVEYVIAMLVRQEECHVHVVVPATPASSEFWVWTEERAQALARRQLDTVLEAALAIGADAAGSIGDASAASAVADMLRAGNFDQVYWLASPVPSVQGWSRSMMSRIRQIIDSTFGTYGNARPI